MNERKPNRLNNYDYSQNGCYFVTICSKGRINHFREIENGEMILNECGKIADDYWAGQIKVHKNIVIDEYIVMPNHVHGILGLFNESVGDAYSKSGKSKLHKNNLPINENLNQQSQKMRPLQTEIDYDRSKMLLSKIIQLYKSEVTKHIKRLSTKPNHLIPSIWQRSFHDHIIRNENH